MDISYTMKNEPCQRNAKNTCRPPNVLRPQHRLVGAFVALPILMNCLLLLYFHGGVSLKDHIHDFDIPDQMKVNANVTMHQHSRVDGETMITCTQKTTNVQVSIANFYAENSRCQHSFKDDTIFFHVGKGGGGTVRNVMEAEHLVHVSVSHPAPNQKYVESLQQGPATTLIINVRDPLDRFVSAFNWRYGILCHPNDSRERGGMLSIEQPQKYCKYIPKEEQMYRETYQSNPSLLAEALCEDSPTRNQAMDDFASIGPAVWSHNSPLVKWLHFLIDESSVQNITDQGIKSFIVLPVPLGKEKKRFKQHIEQLSLHLLQTRYGREVADTIMQYARQNDADDTTIQGHSYEHSSVELSNTTKPPAMTPRGECCLVRYLTDDYRLIQSMLREASGAEVEPLRAVHPVVEKACLWGDTNQQKKCQGDLHSILMRHARYLDLSKGSCSEILRG